jgi:hypothetical protein
MMRLNSYTTWRIRGITDRWLREVGLPDGRDGVVSDENFEVLVMRWYRWFVNPSRILPGGATLRDTAGADLLELQSHVDSTLSALLESAARHGTDTALLFLAVQGAFQASQWWGHPRWPQLVERFLAALDDSTDAHWGPVADWRDKLLPEPPEVLDRFHLKKTLRRKPWKLRTETAEWLIDAGIGFTRLSEDQV